MYAKPELTLVGNAKNVVLGSAVNLQKDHMNSTIFDTRPSE